MCTTRFLPFKKQEGSSDHVNRLAPLSQAVRDVYRRIAGRTAFCRHLDRPFADIAQGAWYGDAVAAAAEAGIVNGRSDSEFAPNEGITREEMAVMLMRAYAYEHSSAQAAALSVTAKPSTDAQAHAPSVSGPFADASSFSGWAADSIAGAAELGLLSGRDGHVFDPSSGLTRAESAQAVYKLLQL